MKKQIRKLHLWLGLASGLIVVLLGLTGCILAFEQEIRVLTEPFRVVTVQSQPLLDPESLKSIANKHLASGRALGIEYPGQGKAAIAMYYDETHYELLFLDPYTGQVLKHKNMNRDFFRVVLNGHFYLWLPPRIGQPIAASATLLFVVMMITGIVLWWPRNKGARKQRFTIKWDARWRRVNFDLHAVLGFYVSWIAIVLALTGLVFGFEWVAKAVYFVSSGGDTLVPHEHPVSDSSLPLPGYSLANHLWHQHLPGLKPQESIGVYFAHQPGDPMEIVVNHKPGTYYNSDFYHYDRYSGAELPATGSYAGKFAEARLADKLVRMNYDIHVGAIAGLPGKVLAFFASLLCASLPVTGFLLWRGRVNKRRKQFGESKSLPLPVFQP